MQKPLISVIVPVYNLKDEVGAMLECLLRQTYPNLEIVAVDDGSTDGSGELLDSYAAQYPNIRAVHRENGGIFNVRITGIRAAAGEWIGFADADDRLAPDMFERLLENALRHEAEISQCGYRTRWADGRETTDRGTGELRVQSREEALTDLLNAERMTPEVWMRLYHRSLFDKLLQEEEKHRAIRFNEDLLINYYLYSACSRAVWQDFRPYVYTLQEQSVCHGRLNVHRIYDRIRVKQFILDTVPEPLLPAAKRAYVSSCVGACNDICMDESGKFREELPRVRELLRQHRDWFRYLSGKRRTLAYLLCYAPGLYPAVYRFYAKRIKKDNVY